MTWILSICFGMPFAICYMQREYEYMTQEDCYKARESILPKVGTGHAVCAPRKEKNK